MTNERKIEILKQARELINYSNVIVSSRGMCWAVCSQLRNWEESQRDLNPYIDDNLTTVYGIEKPETVYSITGWYPHDSEGIESRVRAIDKAIEKLEKEIK